ncbi:hypothetical protein HMPREF2779_02925 [Rothia sp. HMSC069C03]|uniref:DUF885 domain-containing protein n=1 Tax=Rothia sp. HMSC069C03 TaxID=1739283 RepID=UPI0008C4486C|nr:DUF885 domain-containing protein [Rothia sp. HMSC069C03]OFL22592.1 hypothetical protein HMPREF2779_02925 [Rothia sp. HMSC069C03]
MSTYQELPSIYRLKRSLTDVDQIANEYFEKVLDLNPVQATELGRKGVETLYPDYSPAGEKAFARLAKKTLKKVDNVLPIDDVDLVTLDALQERLSLYRKQYKAGFGGWQMNNIASVPQEVRSVFDLMKRNTQQDWEHIIGRMHRVTEALEGYIQTLEAAREEGKVAPRRQVDIVIEQTAAYYAPGGFFDELAAEVAAAVPSLKDEAAAGAEAAKEGYRRLNSYLVEKLQPVAPSRDAVGRKAYSLHSRSFLGTTIDLDETYAWGVKELESIIARQREVAEEIEPGASIERAKQLLDEDPARQLHGTDELKAWMQKLADAAVENLADTHFEIGGPMRRIECCIAPTNEGGIYYTGPSPDFSRPGRMWWSVPEGEDTFTTWRETSTVYHEGVPGHHLQIAIATALKGTMNSWRTNMLWVSGHGEGWALYAERLMEELGYLKDPGDRMGMLNAQRMRAARVVFDIGVHCEMPIPAEWAEQLGVEPGTIWTSELGYEFLKLNLDESEGQQRFEFLRYLGWPGQTPSYKIGERLWLELRDQALRRGDDMRAFHTRALLLGSVGLDTLRRALTDEMMLPLDTEDDDDEDDDE